MRAPFLRQCAGQGRIFSKNDEREEMLSLAKKNQTMSRALQRREDIAGYLFMLPSLIFFLGFVVIPMFICIGYSLTDATMHQQAATQIVGFSNFAKLLQDKVFIEALRNTFVIVIVSVPTVCAFSLWVASAIYTLSGPVLSAFR